MSPFFGQCQSDFLTTSKSTKNTKHHHNQLIKKTPLLPKNIYNHTKKKPEIRKLFNTHKQKSPKQKTSNARISKPMAENQLWKFNQNSNVFKEHREKFPHNMHEIQ